MATKKKARKAKKDGKWMQEVNKKIKKGAFTAQAKKRGESVDEMISDVKSNPGKFSGKTKKRAVLASNFKKARH
jgi:hypothetical protein